MRRLSSWMTWHARDRCRDPLNVSKAVDREYWARRWTCQESCPLSAELRLRIEMVVPKRKVLSRRQFDVKEFVFGAKCREALRRYANAPETACEEDIFSGPWRCFQHNPVEPLDGASITSKATFRTDAASAFPSNARC